MKISKEEFERRYAKQSNVSVEWLREQGFVVKPCDCEYKRCDGWKMVLEIREEDFE